MKIPLSSIQQMQDLEEKGYEPCFFPDKRKPQDYIKYSDIKQMGPEELEIIDDTGDSEYNPSGLLH